MDCFAVSIVQGVQGCRLRPALTMAILFGVFQGGMPLIAYFAGSLFADFFIAWSGWIALVLLSFIGGKMLLEAYREKREEKTADADVSGKAAQLTLWTIIVLAVATSIDALSIGVLFIPVPEVLWLAVAIIAAMSTLFSLIGYTIGRTVSAYLPLNANILGGCILIVIGIKIFFF